MSGRWLKFRDVSLSSIKQSLGDILEIPWPNTVAALHGDIGYVLHHVIDDVTSVIGHVSRVTQFLQSWFGIIYCF
jgi:hypothetical protein